VAVATGSYGVEELEQADWVVDGAPALTELLARLLSD
jgi:hypothetical protein